MRTTLIPHSRSSAPPDKETMYLRSAERRVEPNGKTKKGLIRTIVKLRFLSECNCATEYINATNDVTLVVPLRISFLPCRACFPGYWLRTRIRAEIVSMSALLADDDNAYFISRRSQHPITKLNNMFLRKRTQRMQSIIKTSSGRRQAD